MVEERITVHNQEHLARQGTRPAGAEARAAGLWAQHRGLCPTGSTAPASPLRDLSMLVTTLVVQSSGGSSGDLAHVSPVNSPSGINPGGRAELCCGCLKAGEAVASVNISVCTQFVASYCNWRAEEGKPFSLYVVHTLLVVKDSGL